MWSWQLIADGRVFRLTVLRRSAPYARKKKFPAQCLTPSVGLCAWDEAPVSHYGSQAQTKAMPYRTWSSVADEIPSMQQIEWETQIPDKSLTQTVGLFTGEEASVPHDCGHTQIKKRQSHATGPDVSHLCTSSSFQVSDTLSKYDLTEFVQNSSAVQTS